MPNTHVRLLPSIYIFSILDKPI